MPEHEAVPAPARPGRRQRAALAVRRAAPRSGAAALCGLALAAAFPPYDLWPLSIVAVAGLSLLTRDRTARQGAWLGFAFALPFFLWLLLWLRVVGYDAVFGLSVLEALFVAVLGAGLALTSRLPGWPLWGGCLWVAEELARDRLPFGGFPWGRLAFANTGSPFTPLAALGGAPLVTFAVALTGTLLAAAVLAALRLRAGAARTVRTLLPVAGTAAMAAAVIAAGYAVPVPTQATDFVRVAIVQGNVQQPGMHFLGRPMQILDNHVAATLKLAADIADIKTGRTPKPDLVIWPENSSDLDPFSNPQAYDRITRAVRAVGVPVLVGALVDGPDARHVQNEGIVWDPVSGPGASYTKQHPVPFGEYVPFRAELAKVIHRLDQIPRDFYPGKGTGVLKIGPATLGDVICFEVAYDEIVHDTVTAGARAIIVQTNNATYGRTGQPEQQLAMSRLRAIEHGRAIVTAATSGISAVVAPDGTIEQRTKEFTQDVLSARIPLRDELTVADRVGTVPEWTLAMVGLLSCALAIALGRRGATQTKGQQQ
ncbi:apolipoprotein N-acyltransferase [Streptomyces sp. H10-C2]|uniref:apolipoprotein N-acyltransferase n=1 Tax=unclassified Streptomyces TaxID=2593676 RepID=UPI0024BBB0E4|nr:MULTISPECIES: apolipoprotein N-acyltransferase [unclassified Streptomyces]MDJ0345579.1 apolipoprotein N-acyltransferase [Streptomyces sp. PH10-H1]MDJ0371408.1 apolipoprotein N-acyltransferase [Streptomyces sp. H10-C2]